MARRFAMLIGVAAVGVIALAVAGCGGDDDDEGETTAGQPAALEVTLSDFKIDPKDGQVDEAGVIRFDITNDGETAHQLAIEGHGEIPDTSDQMDPGEDDPFTTELASGKYIWYCPIGNHREQGMEGTLTVE